MKKILFIITILLVSTTLYMCTADGFSNTETTSKIEPIFSENALEWGNLFGENMIYITKKLKNDKKNFKNRTQLNEFFLKNTTNFYNKNGEGKLKNFKKNNSNLTREDIGDIISKNIKPLTENQKRVLKQIAEARNKSKSYIEFSNKLATINNNIYSTVPKNEQKRLFFVTSSLYFGLKAMNEMAKQGIIPGKPEGVENRLTLARLGLGLNLAFAQSESDPPSTDSSWWDASSGTTTLGTIWIVALAEPTPFGEVGASAATIVIGSWLAAQIIYDFATDIYDSYHSGSSYDEETADHCQRLYQLCYGYKCATCLQFCNTQGYWDFDNCPL